MNQTIRLRRTPTPPRTPLLTRRRLSLLAGLLLLLLAAFAAYKFGPDRQLAKVKEMRAGLSAELPPEQRRDRWQEYRKEFEKLSPAQRDVLDREQQQQYFTSLDSFFKLSKKEQTARLDEQINRAEAARRRFEQQRGAGGPRPGSQTFGASGGGQRPRDAEARELRRRQRLDRSTPQQRAQMDLHRRMIDQRRRERGLPVSTGRPR
jgi:hypothetical protein